MEVVNGYVCKTCCDVDLAKRNINPADPRDDVHNPKSPNYGKAEDPRNPGKPKPSWETQAATFGGALAQSIGVQGRADPLQAPSPVGKPYSPGSVASATA